MFKKTIYTFLQVMPAIVIIMAMPAYAADIPVKCRGTKTTADQIQCVKIVLEQKQEELNKIFSQLLGGADPSHARAFKKAQGAWIDYRDLECSLEAQRSGNASLERLEALGCMYNLTKTRIGVLSKLSAEQQSVSEIGIMPRWMNVLGSDNTLTYWDYTGRIESDLNCDGMNEYIMSGIELSNQSVIRPVVAIAQSGETGKPNTILTHFTIRKDEAQNNNDPFAINTVCNPNLAISVASVQQADPEICEAKIYVEDGACFSGYIMMTPQGISLSARHNADMQIRPIPKPAAGEE